MSFIKSRTSAKFYGESQMTFLVQKDCVDIIFKIKKGVYLTVSVYSLSEGRLLLACSWDGFWNRLKQLMNYNLNLFCELDEKCPFPAWKTDLKNLK